MWTLKALPMSLRHELSCKVAAARSHYAVTLMLCFLFYPPWLILCYSVFVLAQFFRMIARFFGADQYRRVNNRRILVITDYMPPQTHGIAIRTHAYVKNLRAEGHEVVVFATAYDSAKETSFDHPNIPSVVNPFNLGNRIGFAPGVKLSWFLGVYTWDVVHLVFPSLIGFFVLSVCAWRRIPVYCSHHVDMEGIPYKHVSFKPLVQVSLFGYNLLAKWPAIYWGTLNSAPTLFYARLHLGDAHEKNLRTVPSGTHEEFSPIPSSPSERQEIRRDRFGVTDDATKVSIMVQRLSSEKGTERVFPAFTKREKGGEGVPGVLVIAGDGPSMLSLQDDAETKNLRVVFLGKVPHAELPALYRAADCFITMSMCETYGLTCLEAQMCGCPAVIPHCGVFDEIWSHRVPKAWRYEVESAPQLASAIRAAQDGRPYLEEHPIRQTWKMAADELFLQYEECISKVERRRKRHNQITVYADQILRIVVMSVLAFYVLDRYYIIFSRFVKSIIRELQ